MTRIAIRVGESPGWSGISKPEWLHHIADFGNVIITNRYPYGCWELSFRMNLKPGTRTSVLSSGRVVEAWLGGVRIWGGLMAQADWDEGVFVAQGYNRQSESAPAVNATWQATSDLDDAIYQAALSATVHWMGYAKTAPYAQQLPAPTQVNHLGASLDQWANLNNVRWGVDADRLFKIYTDPTTPSHFIDSSVADLGVSSESQATDVVVEYYSAQSGDVKRYRASGRTTGARSVRLVNLMELDYINDSVAQTHANNLLKLAGTETAFTGSITVTRGQVTNEGGTAVGPALILPGRMYRHQGMRDPRNGALSTDFIAGETVWDEDAGTVDITPLGAEKNDLSEAIEKIGGELVA